MNHDLPPWATRYTPWAGQKVYSPLPPHSPDARSTLRELVADIVRAEGPVSVDRVVRIVRIAWPVGSGGSKTTEAVQAVARSMIGQQLVSPEPGFLATVTQTAVTVRVPIEADNRTRRTIDEVPWTELHLAVLEVVRGASTVEEDELVTFIARLYGWSRTGAQISTGVATAIAHLIDRGDLQQGTTGAIAVAH